jgi:hypothetical protein
MKYIVIDIDGTCTNEQHRTKHAQNGDWATYFSMLHQDTPNEDVVAALRMFQTSLIGLLSLTGRPEQYRPATLEWLEQYDVPFDYLLMRPDDNRESAEILKLRQLEEFFGSKESVLRHVLFALEDRDKIVKAFRQYGIPTWQVREGGY